MNETIPPAADGSNPRIATVEANAVELVRAWWNGSTVDPLPTLPPEWRPTADGPGENPREFLRLTRRFRELYWQQLIACRELAPEALRATEAVQDVCVAARAWLDWAKRLMTSEARRYSQWKPWRAAFYESESAKSLARCYWQEYNHGISDMQERLEEFTDNPWRVFSLRTVIGPKSLESRAPSIVSGCDGFVVSEPSVRFGHQWESIDYRVLERIREWWRICLQVWAENRPDAQATLCENRWFCARLLGWMPPFGCGIDTNGWDQLRGWLDELDYARVWPLAREFATNHDPIALRRLDRGALERWHDGEELSDTAVARLASLTGFLFDTIAREVGPTVTYASTGTDGIGQALAALLELMERIGRGDGPDPLFGEQQERLPIEAAVFQGLPLSWPNARALQRMQSVYNFIHGRTDMPTDVNTRFFLRWRWARRYADAIRAVIEANCPEALAATEHPATEIEHEPPELVREPNFESGDELDIELWESSGTQNFPEPSSRLVIDPSRHPIGKRGHPRTGSHLVFVENLATKERREVGSITGRELSLLRRLIDGNGKTECSENESRTYRKIRKLFHEFADPTAHELAESMIGETRRWRLPRIDLVAIEELPD